jgi:hypothetical protein
MNLRVRLSRGHCHGRARLLHFRLSNSQGMTKISYTGYRFPPEIIRQAIWLYLRFTLNVEDPLRIPRRHRRYDDRL